MAKDNERLQKVPGSIAYALNKHIKELNALMASPSQFEQLKKKVNEIIASDEVKASFGKEKAIYILSNTYNYNKYLSSLAAYLTGIAVGK